ncbi:uncharacterized protein A1O9_09622 [Exophiala aquamarina CBS 119918]|uniref:Zn(2)-C6 fungal-type domain-containing protein n=1 Tax=Exophiala aquamarina CBS 119918 TaxID=1182545 RepID=A0A072PFX9_9EURO|nr:uncharacterized protein A1O9_09622 [Exophiala aquamarina CBS 119918]KEF54455.1 hypothetical protein A1O9_09622 [Exophiala aquamarina CBS 119918]
MPGTFRQKACIACAASKRRCDKQLPECRRCSDRDEDCVYPQRKRRVRPSSAPDNGRENLLSPDNNDERRLARDNSVQALSGVGLDYGLWEPVASNNTNVSVPESVTEYPQISPPDSTVLPVGANLRPSCTPLNVVLPWFLQEETWAMQRVSHEQDRVADIDLQSFIDVVEGMLKSWVENGYNGFIHRRLYQSVMPTCVQDAFTTYTAYIKCTPAVKETILQITDERLSTIVHQYPPNTGDTQGILNHLARVQALFIYEFIGLFGGSPRLRISAEQQLPTLRSWTAQMWETVRRYKGDDATMYHQGLQWTENDFDIEYKASSELWKVWLLTESVRRTQIIINAVSNSYETMTRGWAECTGAVMITARRGLWEAESAVQWSKLSSKKSPLLVPSVQPGILISQYAAEEFDDFVKIFWTLILGPDKVQCWVDKSNHSSSKLQAA